VRCRNSLETGLRPDDYLPLVGVLARVTANPRDFTVCARHGRNFGFSGRDLDTLARAGLPHRRMNGEHWFRWGDLHYLGLRLGTAKPYLSGIRRWAKTFAQLSRVPGTDIAIDYIPKASRANPHGVLGTVRLPGGRRRTLALRSGAVGVTIRARQHGVWPDPDPHLAAILERFAELQLYVIPESLRDSAAQMMELGLSDCETVAQLAVVACTRERYEARSAYGLLLSFPFSVTHSWAEVRIEGRWMAFDPLTAMAMREFAPDDAPRITGSSCLGAILLRIAVEPVPLVSVDGACIDTIFATRRVSESGDKR
jgi:Transglutaminase-like superfamily